MITQLETAVKTFVAAKLAANTSLSAITFTVRAATDTAELPADRITVICRASAIPREIPRLFDAKVECVVNSPADLAAVTVATHRAVEAALTKVWDKDETPTGPADLSTQIAAEITGWHGGDFFAEGWQPGREDTSFLPVFGVHVGIARDGV